MSHYNPPKMSQIFQDRTHAARLLCEQLKKRKITDGVVLALPRGGVPVGYEIARALHLPLDIFLSKKIGYPGNPEFAVGSVTLEGAVLNSTAAAVDPVYLEEQIVKIRLRLQHQYERYYGNRQPLRLSGKTVILTDDGVATGNTMLAAIQVIRRKDLPARIIVAVPVAPTDVAQKLREAADELICPVITDDFFAIGAFYENFETVEDEEVITYLEHAEVM